MRRAVRCRWSWAPCTALASAAPQKHRREEGARAGVLRRRSSLWSGHHLDTRHHAPVLVLEDVAVIDELTELRELDVEHLRVRRAPAFAPVVDGANPVLIVVDL